MASLGSRRSLPRFLAYCFRSHPAERNECSSCNVLFCKDTTEPRSFTMYEVDQRAKRKRNEGPLTTTRNRVDATNQSVQLLGVLNLSTASLAVFLSDISSTEGNICLSFVFFSFFRLFHRDHAASSLRPSSQALCIICCTTLLQGHFFFFFFSLACCHHGLGKKVRGGRRKKDPTCRKQATITVTLTNHGSTPVRVGLFIGQVP